MARLKKKDINEILELFEDELNSIRNLDRIEKMKMRAKIMSQSSWLLAFGNPTTIRVTKKLEEKLGDLFRLYPSGFKDKLKKLVKKKIDGMSS